jgi:lactate dehydrogenase-like 2-hydroxyacid dehydrogenase
MKVQKPSYQSVGFDHIDTTTAQLAILKSIIAQVITHPVAEFAFSLILSLLEMQHKNT